MSCHNTGIGFIPSGTGLGGGHGGTTTGLGTCIEGGLGASGQQLKLDTAASMMRARSAAAAEGGDMSAFGDVGKFSAQLPNVKDLHKAMLRFCSGGDAVASVEITVGSDSHLLQFRPSITFAIYQKTLKLLIVYI